MHGGPKIANKQYLLKRAIQEMVKEQNRGNVCEYETCKNTMLQNNSAS